MSEKKQCVSNTGLNVELTGKTLEKREVKTNSDNEYCSGCEQCIEYCHEKIHGSYCYMNVFNKYGIKNNVSCTKFELMSWYCRAYNESRRVDLYLRFGFVCNDNKTVPLCMEQSSRKRTLFLINNLQEAKNLSRTHDRGMLRYAKAQRDRKA